MFGRTAAEGMRAMKRGLQWKLANEVLTVMETGASLFAFRRALLVAFPDCLLYQSRLESHWLLLYLGRKETETNKKQLQFILDGFLPLDFQVKVFWQYHFGLMGIDATMQMDHIAIF